MKQTSRGLAPSLNTGHSTFTGARQRLAVALVAIVIAFAGAQTAGAQTIVRDAAGFAEAFDDTNVSEINVTDNITGVGDLYLDRDLTINLNGHTISGDELYFNVDPDCSLTINGEGQGGSVGNFISGNAYGPAINNSGTVTLSHVNITTNYDCAIGGPSMLYIGENVSFNGWTQAPFYTPYVNIEGGNYNYDPENYNPRANVVATVTVGGVTHYFENLSVALDYFANNPGNDGFSLWGDTYTIKTAADWGLFCDMQEIGETFSGKTVELANDIGTTEAPVTRMGSSTTQFRGTFDGAGHTLTVQYGTASEPVNQQFVAPFPNVTGGATFRNLTIAGSIYSGYATSDDKGTGGLIGHLFGGVTVEHCVSTVTVNAASDRAGGFVGLCEHAVTFTDCVSSAIVTCTGSGSGFVGWSRNGEHTIAFYGCLFSGKVLKQGNVGSGNGSFVGWKGFTKTVTITNCIAAPATDENMATDNSATFCRYSADTTLDNGETHITNCYYTATLGNAQGNARHTVTAGTDVTVAHAGVATHYATSGITAYKATGASADINPFIAGLLYNNNEVDVLYAGSDDVVSLTLSNTCAPGAPDGYSYGYTANAGTLEGSTLTMPAADVTVSVNTAILLSTHEAVEVSYVDAGGTTRTHDAIALDGTETVDEFGNVNLAAGWYFVGTDIAFDHTLELNVDVHLILADGCTMNVTSSDDNGIDFNGSLTIYGQTDGTGTLNATSTDGIYTNSGYITISGGTVTATGDSEGIHSDSGDITISGGRVTATGDNGYGIHSGSGEITISGGRVTVTGDNGGITTNSGDINISGGRVTVTGENSDGIFTISGDITISGGRVTVTGENSDGIRTFSGTITLGCTTASDFIYASSYVVGPGDRLNIVGQTLFDEDGNYYRGNGVTIPAGKTLRPYDCRLPLRDYADNTAAIAAANGKVYNVTLQGRTLYKDGAWNTLCLPFAMTAEQVTAQLAPAKLMTLSSSAFAGQELTLNFEDATTIEPGKPYIIKWTRPDGYTVDGGFDITNPVFTGVTIPSGYTSSEAITAALATASCSTDYVTFIGTYGPTAIYTDPATNLYLGSGNTLYWPSSAKDINSFRAYFHLNNGLTASTPAGARAFVLNFGDEETTGVVPIDNGQLTIDNSAAAAWYDMQGRKLLAQPTARGIYIHGGKKVVIK